MIPGPDLQGSQAQGWPSSCPGRPTFLGPQRPQQPSTAFTWLPFFSPATPNVQRRHMMAAWVGLGGGPKELGWAAGEVWAPRGECQWHQGGGQGGGGDREKLRASQSGPNRWAAAARAPGLCGSEPATCPRDPQFTHWPQARGPGGPQDRRPHCISRLALCGN